MAKLVVDGVDEAIRALEKADLYDEEAQKELLFTGADVIAESIQEQVSKSRFDIRHLVKRIKRSNKVKTLKNGDRACAVTVSGKNKHGVRNSVILFVLNYGRRKQYGQIVGEYFWTRGTKNAEKKVQEVVEAKASEILRKRGL